MKKIILASLLLLFITGCTNTSKSMLITTISNETCDFKPKLLTTKDNSNIYTYCLENITIKKDNKTNSLKDYLKNNNSIDTIIKKLKLEDNLYDGGTTIYKGNNITLIKCNTLSGNKDIYIGDENLKFKENFCKDNNETFIRTYTVNNIQKYMEQQYENDIPVTYANSYLVELTQFQVETKEVIINNLTELTLENGNTYEFEFMLNDNVSNISDNIEWIFNNSTIIDIRKSTKTGLDQIQEKVK